MSVETTAPFRRVVGTLIRGVADGLLGGAQGIPLAGAQVTATASVKSAASGEFIVLDPVDGTTDQNARLRNASTGEEGILLLVTDDPSIGVIGWTWHITVTAPSLNRPGKPPRVIEFDIDVPSGEGDIDLATLVPVPGNVGEDVILWRAAVDQTQANLEASEAIVATSVDDARLDGDDLELIRRDGSVIPVGNVRGLPGRSAYEIAVSLGFVGTEAEYEESLHGQDGSNVVPTDEAVAGNVAAATGTLTGAAVRRITNQRGIGGADYISVGATNNTSEVQAMLNAAGERNHIAALSPGTYPVAGLTIPNHVIFDGWGGGTARYGTSAEQYGAVKIIRMPGTTDPMVTLAGHAAGIRNITIDGNSLAGRGLVTQGFESLVDQVRVIRVKDIALDVERANNTKWSNIYIDNSGTPTLPAMKVWSKPDTGGAGETNTLDVDGLTIERCANTHLNIAYDAASQVGQYAEFVRISRLHVEAGSGGGGSTPTSPVVHIGNVRGVVFINPWILGGPSPLITHEQLNTSYPEDFRIGGVHLVDGFLVGSSGSDGVTPTVVDLVSGNDFRMEGTRIWRYSTQSVRARSTYGDRVFVGPSSSTYGNILTDDRAAPTRAPFMANVGFVAVHRVQGNRPTLVAHGGASSPTMHGTSTDMSGRVLFGTGLSTAAGVLLEVNFAKPISSDPIVTLTASSSAAADLKLFAAPTATGFQVRAREAPPVNQPAGTFQVNYHVVG